MTIKELQKRNKGFTVVDIKKVKCGYCRRRFADFMVNPRDSSVYHFRCINHVGWFIEYHRRLGLAIKVFEIRDKKISDIKKWTD